MLTQILKEFRESSGTVNLNELGRRLGVERPVLDGMLETLVRQGKLREVRPTGSCDGSGRCGSGCGGCHCGDNAARQMGKSYQVVRPSA